jgi:hypothetical protein
MPDETAHDMLDRRELVRRLPNSDSAAVAQFLADARTA